MIIDIGLFRRLGQGSQTNSSKAVRNYWFESAAIGANQRIKPQVETEDSS